MTLSLCVLSIIVSERTLHGALSWQPKDRDRLFLNYRYNMQHVIHEALPHALDDRGQPDEELTAMEQRFAQENNATTRSGISRNMMTKEVYERLDLDSRELMARVGYLEVKDIVLRSSDQLHGVEDLAKL